MSAEGKSIFVTVGTTSFDDLIKEVDSEAFHAEARGLGYTSVTIQRGRGQFRPIRGESDESSSTLQMTSFDFKPTLAEEMNSASLVVSHAGAGSVIESLRAGRRLLVVVNPSLMNNHQLELAEAMHRRGFCAIARQPSEVIAALAEASKMQVPSSYPARDLQLWHSAVEDTCGVAPAG
eukprot:TRINITY_DN108451_c0_g1_i1.p1 TRINITY_DN108451_c0_g1~~TRINITY_DN108451_c0_g1_i1.p1  ORF type:complete len:178 (+),score=26.67 TRINITY_DN108451_c0_g1_i1:85-618(+)